MRNLDTLNPTAPLLHYTCFRCGDMVTPGHRCGPDVGVPTRAAAVPDWVLCVGGCCALIGASVVLVVVLLGLRWLLQALAGGL